MSDFTFACPACGQHISADEMYRGQQVQCPHCRHSFVVPTGERSAPEPDLAPPVRTPAKSSASRWPTVLFWVGFAVVACGIAGLNLHLRSAPRRSIDKLVGKNVVVAAPEAPDAQVLSTSDVSPFAKIRVQNPPGAITFVLELKKAAEEFYAQGAQAWKNAKPVDEFSGQGTQLHFGVAKIFFDTDDNVNTGERGPAGGPRGYEFELDATLMAKGERGLADWANAHVNLPNARGHALRSPLINLPSQPGPRFINVNQRNDLSRGKVDGKMMWITVTYSELGVSPGQSVRITFMDQGNAVYTDGEMLPSFAIKLQ